jgi:hypothetical protein
MALSLILGASSAWPGPLSGCYERSYNAGHLAAHQGQRVRKVILALTALRGHEPWVASFSLELALRGRKGLASLSGDCTKDGNSLSCAGDCDTGAFHLARAPHGKLLLTISGRLLLQRNGCDEENYEELTQDEENTSLLLGRAKPPVCK